jgi:hypothetical protein
MEKIVSLLYDKEKASNAFFGTNVNKSVHFFVYGFRLTYFFHIDPTFYSLNVWCLWSGRILLSKVTSSEKQAPGPGL